MNEYWKEEHSERQRRQREGLEPRRMYRDTFDKYRAAAIQGKPGAQERFVQLAKDIRTGALALV